MLSPIVSREFSHIKIKKIQEKKNELKFIIRKKFLKY